MCANSVTNVIQHPAIWQHINSSTLESDHLCVKSATNDLQHPVIWIDINSSTLERNHLRVKSVTNVICNPTTSCRSKWYNNNSFNNNSFCGNNNYSLCSNNFCSNNNYSLSINNSFKNDGLPFNNSFNNSFVCRLTIQSGIYGLNYNNILIWYNKKKFTNIRVILKSINM